MILRKINAVLSLITTFLLLDHAIFNAVWMLSQGTIPKTTALSWVLIGFMAVHAIISIELGMSAHKGAEPTDAKTYPRKNAIIIVQRITGMLLIIFTALHVMGATGAIQTPAFIHAFVPALFFVICMAHTAISTSKAFVTLGVGNAKVVKVIDIAVKVVCVATLVADIVGFYLYLV